jgi:hypothetical protein
MVRVTEFATRQLAPAPSAAAAATQGDGANTNASMHSASAASAVAARRRVGWRLDRRNEPSTVPAPSAAMNHPDQADAACS